MGFFFHTGPKTIAVLDIASGSVGGALVIVPEKGLPIFLHSIRVPIQQGDDSLRGLVRALDDIVYTFTHLSPELRRAVGHGRVSEVRVVFHAPWQNTEVSTKTLEDEKPFLITNEVLAKLQGPEGKETLHSHTIMSAMLNGYLVRQPLGKKVSKATFSLLSSDMEKEVLQKIRQVIRKIAPVYSFSSYTTILPQALTKLVPEQREYLLVTVTEEETTLTTVRQGGLTDVRTVPLGTQSFTRAARTGGLTTFSSTGTLIDTTRNTRLDTAMKSAQDTWLTALKEALGKTGALPSTVFLLASPEARDFVKRVMEKDVLSSLWISGNMRIVPLVAAPLSKRLVFEPSPDLDVMLGYVVVGALEG